MTSLKFFSHPHFFSNFHKLIMLKYLACFILCLFNGLVFTILYNQFLGERPYTMIKISGYFGEISPKYRCACTYGYDIFNQNIADQRRCSQESNPQPKCWGQHPPTIRASLPFVNYHAPHICILKVFIYTKH